MERFQKIVLTEKYKEEYEKLQRLERDRVFCRHDMEHFLAVARICYIFVLEQQMDISKDLVYAIALVHDLGRAVQYEAGESHEKAGARLGAGILAQCGYEDWEIRQMEKTVLGHRSKESRDAFSTMFYKADKLSRDCTRCGARKECYWPPEKKNDTYTY